MSQVSRPRPERADSPELAAFRRLKVEQPELAGAVDMQVELVVLQRRVQARLTTPWLVYDPDWLARQFADGAPIVRFEDVLFEWGELRGLFRQITDVLRRYNVLENPDHDALQGIVRSGRPETADVAAWYNALALRHRPSPSVESGLPDAYGQVLAVTVRPFLGRTVETLSSRIDLTPWTRPYCPFCGGDPELAVLTPSGDYRLACGRCVGIWPFGEHICPHCDNRNPSRRTSFASRDGRYRLVACDVCQRYMKMYDARGADRPFMLDVDAIATLPLDAAALQRGYVG
jgi:hypothetical protein